MKTEFILFAIWAISTAISLYDVVNSESWNDPIEGVDQGSLAFICIIPVLNTFMCFATLKSRYDDKYNPPSIRDMIRSEVRMLIVRQRIYNPHDTYECKLYTAADIVKYNLIEKEGKKLETKYKNDLDELKISKDAISKNVEDARDEMIKESKINERKMFQDNIIEETPYN